MLLHFGLKSRIFKINFDFVDMIAKRFDTIFPFNSHQTVDITGHGSYGPLRYENALIVSI